jgi:hypothetical protein
MEIKELDEAESLIERGDLRPALKRIDVARNKALGAQNMEVMSRVASAAEALRARADGRLLKAADKQVRLVEQNRQFLARAAEANRAQVQVDPRSEGALDDVATAQVPTSSDAFVARGRNGQLTVTPSKIIISRKGVSGFMLHGHKGEKEIDLHQMRPSGTSSSRLWAAARRNRESWTQPRTKTPSSSRRARKPNS